MSDERPPNEALERRVVALNNATDLLIADSGRVPEGVDLPDTVLDVAHRFDLWLKHGGDAPKSVLAIQGTEHIRLRTRDNAIETMTALLDRRALEMYLGPGGREKLAAELVDALLETDG